jgi:hypothetical protein
MRSVRKSRELYAALAGPSIRSAFTQLDLRQRRMLAKLWISGTRND